MSENTKIEWCDHTFNPWIGCTKVSPGCANCYAETESKRRGWAQWGKGKSRYKTSENYWKQPVVWNKRGRTKLARRLGWDKFLPRRRVFCASLADWLDDEVPIEWLADLMKLICETPNLDWLLLTKRPENLRSRMEEIVNMIPKCNITIEEASARALADAFLTTGGTIVHNVWVGTSVEDQKRADERIPWLLKIPAKVRFLSCEPLLGPLNFLNADEDRLRGGMTGEIHWVIIGGESGPKSRKCNIEWIRSLISQCKAAGVAPFVKQLGHNPVLERVQMWGAPILKDRKGGDMSEWPADLRIREFPKV